MLSFRVRHGVEPPHPHNLSDSIASTIVGVRVSAQHAAKICLQPELIGRFSLFAALVNAVTLDRSGERGVHAHIHAGKSIVAARAGSAYSIYRADGLGSIPVGALNRLGRGRLAKFLVCQSIDVGGQTRRRRCVDTSNMVINANLAPACQRRCLSDSLCRQEHTCFPGCLRGCFSRWTRSGGPSSRNEPRDSVRASIDSCRISSVILDEGKSAWASTNLCWAMWDRLGDRRRNHCDGLPPRPGNGRLLSE